jgi:hypothetical protein
MPLLTASRGTRLFALTAACAALVAGVLIWFNAASDSRSEISGTLARAAWKTVEYRGVQIDIPSAWERSDMSGCEFQFEQWAAPGSPACRLEGGAAFYGSATFDPFHGPGVWQTATTWSGYAYAGDYAVYVSDTDRDLVQKVVDSARATR